ncbi:serine/arginine repetitive matrix protein 1-like isoform X2 [Sander lucioperca]|uniref:serine/arginine repetitive matrix protein 1-like isoform X2 n=1 Tax=Sander lucioperca TaxID=283035 RepID=UPI001653E9AB|nr:serine/arginine repetitive matrix protein 1-like isoform X2 [Sander lucioperca]XP_035855910.1 serine/arginine repetitive matrix protein 1-like isoform X2 [Sander lucioperca]
MNRGTKRPKGGAEKKREKTKIARFTTPVYKREIIKKMFRSIFGLKFFARPRSSGDMDSSSKKSKRRSERPSSPEDLNPPTILREHGRRGERPSSSGGTNPSTIMKEHRKSGEGPLSCAENQPSITRQQERRDVSSLFIVGTNPSTIMKEHRQKGESPLSCAENKSSTTRQQIRRGESPSSSSSEDKQPSTPRRQQAWRGESPSSSSSEDDQPPTTRQRVRRFESPSSSSSEDKQPSTPRRQQAWRGESPPSSSSEDDQPSSTRQQERKDVSSLFLVGANPSTIMKESRQRGESSLSCAENKPSTTRQQGKRAESTSSSSSENDEPSTTKRQQQQSPLSFVDINLSTTFRQDGGIGENHLPCIDIDQPTIWWEHVRRGERPLSRGDFNPSNTLRQDGRSGDSPSSTSSSSEDDEPSTTRRQQERRANSPLSINLSVRKRLEEEGLKRERERCEKMKRKNQEKERKTFGLLSRINIWWLNCKIDRIARKIHSTHVDERYLLRHGPLRNPKKMAEKERLLDRRRELILYKHRQEFKLEREVRKQRLKVERKEIDVKKMENISELCCNSDSPDMLNLRYGPMPVRSPKLRLVNIYHLREYESNQKNGIKQREVIEGDSKHFRFDKTEVKRRQAWV